MNAAGMSSFVVESCRRCSFSIGSCQCLPGKIMSTDAGVSDKITHRLRTCYSLGLKHIAVLACVRGTFGEVARAVSVERTLEMPCIEACTMQ